MNHLATLLDCYNALSPGTRESMHTSIILGLVVALVLALAALFLRRRSLMSAKEAELTGVLADTLPYLEAAAQDPDLDDEGVEEIEQLVSTVRILTGHYEDKIEA